MARGLVPYEGSATPNRNLDAEDYGGSPATMRETMQVGGVSLGEIAEVKSANPTTGLAGLVVRTRDRATSTATLANVAGSVTSVTVLAANAERIGATVYNDSTATLRLKFGATASATSFTVLLFANQYFTLPAGYTGLLDGIWESAAGNARVTEW